MSVILVTAIGIVATLVSEVLGVTALLGSALLVGLTAGQIIGVVLLAIVLIGVLGLWVTFAAAAKLGTARANSLKERFRKKEEE